MEIEVKNYTPEFIEKQVELGQEVMKSWKYNSQSSVDHLKKVYVQDNFQPDFRIYAFYKDKLIGFQTGHLYDDMVGRIEFPISNDENVILVLQNEIERRFKKSGAKSLRVRASPHWGNTEELTKRFDFDFEKPHLMTNRIEVDKLKISEKQENLDFYDVSNTEIGKSIFKEIFPKRFPMRYEGEIDEWYKYYKDQNPPIWFVVSEDKIPLGHMIGFKRDDNLALTSFFAINESQGKILKQILNEVVSRIQKTSDFKTMSLSIGDHQIPFAAEIDEIGINLKSVVSYYIKNLV